MKRRYLVWVIIISIMLCLCLGCGKASSFSAPMKLKGYIYAQLKKGDVPDIYSFDGKKDQEFYMRVSVPASKNKNFFRPYVALISDTLYQRDKVEFEVPKDYGVVLFIPAMDRYFRDETIEAYCSTIHEVRMNIPQDGKYYIAVYGGDRAGKYILNTNLKGVSTNIYAGRLLKISATIIFILGIIFVIVMVYRYVSVHKYRR